MLCLPVESCFSCGGLRWEDEEDRRVTSNTREVANRSEKGCKQPDILGAVQVSCDCPLGRGVFQMITFDRAVGGGVYCRITLERGLRGGGVAP